MTLSDKQMKAIWNMFSANNQNNEYLLSLMQMGLKTEAECLINGMNKISEAVNIEQPQLFPFPSKEKEC